MSYLRQRGAFLITVWFLYDWHLQLTFILAHSPMKEIFMRKVGIELLSTPLLEFRVAERLEE